MALRREGLRSRRTRALFPALIIPLAADFFEQIGAFSILAGLTGFTGTPDQTAQCPLCLLIGIILAAVDLLLDLFPLGLGLLDIGGTFCGLDGARQG